MRFVARYLHVVKTFISIGRDWEYGPGGGGTRWDWQGQQGKGGGHQPGRGQLKSLSEFD